MGKVTVWNRTSTNYGQNAFVEKNGTDSFVVESKSQAMRWIVEAINNWAIYRLDLELATGKITWVRDRSTICKCDECDCNGCREDDDNDPKR